MLCKSCFSDFAEMNIVEFLSFLSATDISVMIVINNDISIEMRLIRICCRIEIILTRNVGQSPT